MKESRTLVPLILNGELEMAESNVVNGVAKPKRVMVDAKVFVQEWMREKENGGCYTALAERLGMRPSSAYQRAQKLNAELREAKLPTLPSLPEKAYSEGKRKLDLTSLAALIQGPLAPLDTDEQVAE